MGYLCLIQYYKILLILSQFRINKSEEPGLDIKISLVFDDQKLPPVSYMEGWTWRSGGLGETEGQNT